VSKATPQPSSSFDELVAEMRAKDAAKDARIDRMLDTMERQSQLQNKILEVILGQGLPVSAAPLAPPAGMYAPAPLPPVPPRPPIFGPTFAELWTRYLQTIVHQSWCKNVESQMERVLQHFAPSVAGRRAKSGRYRPIAYHGPDMLALAIKPYHWSDFRDQLVREGKIAAGFRNLMLVRTRVCFNFHVGDERIDKNPLAKVKKEAVRPKRQSEYNEDVIAEVLGWCDQHDPYFAAYFLGVVDSGMRPGEVRRLKRADVDLETGRTELSWTSTKTKRSRVVWLTDRAIERFKRLPIVDGTENFFPSPYRDNRPVSKSRFDKVFSEIRQRFGIEAAPGDGNIRVHDGRRTYISRLNREGAQITLISELVGHANINTTMGYITTRESALKEAHDKLQGAIRKDAHRAPATQPIDDDT
jgi:integrase